MKRRVIIHNHLFKNAGTTFDWSLSKNFGHAFCDHRDDEPMKRYGESFLIKYLEEHPGIKALSSHHIWFMLTQHLKIELIPVFILRHPIERILSVYNFEKLQPPNTPGARMAKNMDFIEYVCWRMQEDVPAVIRNFQTRRMAGIKKNRTLTEQESQQAFQQIKKLSFVGIVDRYDESMKVFEYNFNKIGTNINLSYMPQNVSQHNKKLSLEQRINEVLEKLGRQADQVMENNKYDLQLYYEANSKLTEQIQFMNQDTNESHSG